MNLPNRRVLRLMAWGYAVKTLIVGAAWILIPDLPQLALTAVRSAFVD